MVERSSVEFASTADEEEVLRRRLVMLRDSLDVPPPPPMPAFGGVRHSRAGWWAVAACLATLACVSAALFARAGGRVEMDGPAAAVPSSRPSPVALGCEPADAAWLVSPGDGAVRVDLPQPLLFPGPAVVFISAGDAALERFGSVDQAAMTSDELPGWQLLRGGDNVVVATAGELFLFVDSSVPLTVEELSGVLSTASSCLPARS